MPKKTPKHLDFICIGAAKSATTTLYDLLKGHPEIILPTNKEAPFFSDDRVYHNGLSWYLATYFPVVSKTQKVGTITPQYMIGEGDVTVRRVAERIKQDAPNVKLIAILRHPIGRSFSHYRMLRKRGYETRSFEEAMLDNLSGKTDISNYTEPDSNYIGCSEYGNILKIYYSLFPEENILVLTTDDLKNNPEHTVNTITKFLSVSSNYLPPNPQVISRKGGGKPRVRLLSPGFLFGIPLVKKVWQNYMPQNFRRRIEYSINLWNTAPDNESMNLTEPTKKKLVSHFKNDLEVLKSLNDIELPWPELK